jgi:hypothetical protein
MFRLYVQTVGSAIELMRAVGYKVTKLMAEARDTRCKRVWRTAVHQLSGCRCREKEPDERDNIALGTPSVLVRKYPLAERRSDQVRQVIHRYRSETTLDSAGVLHFAVDEVFILREEMLGPSK